MASIRIVVKNAPRTSINFRVLTTIAERLNYPAIQRFISGNCADKTMQWPLEKCVEYCFLSCAVQLISEGRTVCLH